MLWCKTGSLASKKKGFVRAKSRKHSHAHGEISPDLAADGLLVAQAGCGQRLCWCWCAEHLKQKNTHPVYCLFCCFFLPGDRREGVCCLTLTRSKSPSELWEDVTVHEGVTEWRCRAVRGEICGYIMSPISCQQPNVVQRLHLVEGSEDRRCWGGCRKCTDAEFTGILTRDEMLWQVASKDHCSRMYLWISLCVHGAIEGALWNKLQQFTWMNHFFIGHMWADYNKRWIMRPSLFLSAACKPVEDVLKPLNAAGWWISFQNDSRWIFSDGANDVTSRVFSCASSLLVLAKRLLFQSASTDLNPWRNSWDILRNRIILLFFFCQEFEEKIDVTLTSVRWIRSRS